MSLILDVIFLNSELFIIGFDLGLPNLHSKIWFIRYKELIVCYDMHNGFDDTKNLFVLSPGKGKEYWDEEIVNEEMPSCRQMFNIFHPFDPVAYRSLKAPFVMRMLRMQMVYFNHSSA